MIDKKQVEAQLARLGVLPYFSQLTEEAKEELRAAIATAESVFHASAAITEITQWGGQLPMPAEIRRCLHNAKPSKRADHSAPKCELCNGTKFKPYGLLLTVEHMGESTFVSRDRMIVPSGDQNFTARFIAAFQQLQAKLGPNQKLYEFVEACQCSNMTEQLPAPPAEHRPFLIPEGNRL